jgi:hypothetical protein
MRSPVKKTVLSGASHFSIVWGITLAAITLIEWHSLDRDPLNRQILSPFIERQIAVTVANAPDSSGKTMEAAGEPDDSPEAALQYEVDFKFNGPLFLACFFVPILVFQGIGMLLGWLRRRRAGA